MIKDSILKNIIFDNERKFNHYHKRLQIRDDLFAHAYADKSVLMNFIEDFFPSEPQEIREYRKNTLSAVTNTYYTKIINTITRIRNSKTFNVDYADENIEMYFENINDTNKDIISYFFDYLFKPCITDANSFIVIFDTHIYFYDTKNVIFYDDENLLIQISEKEYYLYDFEGRKIIKHVDDEDKFEVYDDIDFSFENGKKYWFKSGGDVNTVCHKSNDVIYDSILQSIAIYFRDAIIQYSDKQAGVKEHLFPLFWTAVSDDCTRCKGSGMCEYQDEQYNIRSATCSDCGGTGKIAKGMFSQLIINESLFSEKTPIPPAGYIQKDFASIEFLNRDYKENIYAGLSSVNMEHLFDVPLSQSGIAKEIDRKEFYSFLNRVLNWCVYIINNIYEHAMYFYAVKNNIEDYYDITPYLIATKTLNIDDDNDNDTLAAQNSILKKQKINDYIENNIVDEDKRKIAKIINELDTHSELTTQEKLSLYEKNIIDENEIYILMNIERIVKELYYLDEKFSDMSYIEKNEKLYEYAKTKKQKN